MIEIQKHFLYNSIYIIINIPITEAVSANVALVALIVGLCLVGLVKNAAIGVVPSGISSSINA